MNALLRANKLSLQTPLQMLSVLGASNCSLFSTSACRQKRKSTLRRRRPWEPKHPFDHRFHISPKDVKSTEHGAAELKKKLGTEHGRAQMPGYYDDKGRFHKVPEMVPEFVVPDLEGFELKPYVSFKVPIKEETPELTAEDLFNQTYARDIVKRYREGDLPDPDTYFQQKSHKKD